MERHFLLHVLPFFFLSSMVFPVGQLGSVVVVLSIELKMENSEDNEEKTCSGSSKVT